MTSKCLYNCLQLLISKPFSLSFNVKNKQYIHSSPFLAKTKLSYDDNVLNNAVLDSVVLKSNENNDVTKLLDHLSPEDAKKLKILKLEFDVLYSTGVRVPESMQEKDWLHVLENCASPISRKKYYNYLFRIEKHDENKRVKTVENINRSKENYLKVMMESELYDLNFKNRFLLNLQSATEHRHENNNLCYAMLNGPHLVLDAGYDDQMTMMELKDLDKQLQACHGVNKVHPSPFHFHFCNLSRTNRLFSRLKNSMDPDKLMISHTDQHYLQVYSKERLVYLSPNAPKVLKKFDPDDVYIIGCLVDKSNELPLSLAKAKKDQIRTYRLPIDENIKWISGSKSISLNQIVQILLTVKSNGNNWFEAFTRHLPKRKIFDYERNAYIGVNNKGTKPKF